MLTPTNLKITVASRVLTCMQIQESMKGGYSTYNIISRGSGAIFMPRESFWCNLRLDAKLETIKWPFLD